MRGTHEEKGRARGYGALRMRSTEVKFRVRPLSARFLWGKVPEKRQSRRSNLPVPEGRSNDVVVSTGLMRTVYLRYYELVA